MIDRKYTADDLDAIRSVVSERGYRLIEERLVDVVMAARAELERDLDPYKTAKCRGLIEGLQIALNTGDTMIEEISAEVKEEDHGE